MEDSQFITETEMLFAGEEATDDKILQAKRVAAAEKVVQHLTTLADDAVLKRQPIERRWLSNMCQYWGVRSVSELTTKSSPLTEGVANDPKNRRSTVFVNITRPKTNRIIGRLFDILFPADDKNWGISPTPVPELNMVAKKAMEAAEEAAEEANRLAQGEEEGAMSPDGLTQDDLLQKAGDLGPQAAAAQKEIDEAKARSERMAAHIDDQLVEARYAQKSRDALEWAGKIGVGILKGPVVMDGGRTAWKRGADDRFALQPSGEKARPTVEVVSPWGFYPDPSATCLEDAEYIFERHLLSRSGLRKMGKKLGFFPQRMQELMKDGPSMTTGTDFNMIRDLRTLSGEDASIANRYVVWEYHGSLETEHVVSLLQAVGSPEALERAEAFEKEANPYDEVRVIAYFCDGKLLKLSEYYPMDSSDFIYSVYSLEKGAATILGAIGIPEIMRDSQEVLNAAWRMMMDNAKLAVGPQVLIDKSVIDPADGSWDMYPGKEWLFNSRAMNREGAKPFEIFNIPMNQAEIAGIISLAKSFIDDETAMPSFIEGGNSEEKAPGAASTVGGFAMLLNSAGVNVRRMVKNWDDDVTTGVVCRLYDWNMQHSDRDEIKGDMQVEARGTSVLLVREMQSQALMAISVNWTVHPVLGMMFKSYELARITLQATGISPNDVLIDRDEFEKRLAAAAKEEAPEDPQWMARKEIATIDAESRKYQADAQREVGMMRLSEESKVSIADIAAKLESTRDALRSKERLAAAEIAFDSRVAAEAKAEGRTPTGSGGYVSAGTKEL